MSGLDIFSDSVLRAELDRREKRRKEEEAKAVEKPKPKAGYFFKEFGLLFDACTVYMDALDHHGSGSGNREVWERNIGVKALTCIYGADVWKWIDPHYTRKEERP